MYKWPAFFIGFVFVIIFGAAFSGAIGFDAAAKQSLPEASISEKMQEKHLPLPEKKSLISSEVVAGEAVTEKSVDKIVSKLIDNNYVKKIDKKNMKPESKVKRNGITSATYSQTFKGLPVYGSKSIFVFKGNVLKLAESNFFEKINLDTKPKISESDVAKIVNSGDNMKPELMILPTGENSKTKFRLIYKIDTPLDNNLNAYSYFIDADSGEIIKKFDRKKFEAGSVTGKVYPENPTKGSAIVGMPFQYVFVESGLNNVFFSSGGEDTENYLETNDLLLTGAESANISFSIKGDMREDDYFYLVQTFFDDTISSTTQLYSLSRPDFYKFTFSIEPKDSYIDIVYLTSSRQPKSGIFIDNINVAANYSDGSSKMIFFDGAGDGFDNFFGSSGFSIEQQPAVASLSLTNADGSYEGSLGGNNISSINISAMLSGPLVHTYDFAGRSAYSSATDFNWNWESEDASYKNEETNVFFHMNAAKAFFFLLGEDLEKTTANVETANLECNAFALPDLLQSSIYFGGQGGGCEATSLGSDIIYHEYTHLVFDDVFDNLRVFYREVGAMDEGTSDYFAASLTGDPAIGEDIFPANDVRHLNNSLVYPDDFIGGVDCVPTGSNDYCYSHDNGIIISGAMWDLRTDLRPSLADELIYMGLKLGAPTTFSGTLDSILAYDSIAYAGSNKNSICSAFTGHGIESENCQTVPTTSTTTTIPPVSTTTTIPPTTTSTTTTTTSSTTTTTLPPTTTTTVPPATTTTTSSTTTTTLPPTTTTTVPPTTSSTTTTSTTTTTLPETTTTTVPPATTSTTTTTLPPLTTTTSTTTTIPPTTTSTTTSTSTTTTLPPTTTTTITSTTTTLPPTSTTTSTTTTSTTTTTIPPTAHEETISFPNWFKTDFSHRKKIEVSNSGAPLKNYSVPLNLSFNEKMQNDFSDIRFTWNNSTANVETDLPYWIESAKEGGWSYVWVNIPEISSEGETLYIYYGNKSPVVSESNGYNTFPFFDDFENSDSIDSNKWFVKTGDWIIQNGNLISNRDRGLGIIATKQKMENYSTKISAKYNGSAIISSSAIGIRYDNSTSMENSYSAISSIANSQSFQCDFGHVNLVDNNTMMESTSFKKYCYSNNTYHTFELGASGGKINYKTDGENKFNFYDSTLKDGYSYILAQYAADANSESSRFSVDWVLQRPLSDIEPTVLFGKEETAPEDIKISNLNVKIGFRNGLGGEIKFLDKTADATAFLIGSTRTKGLKVYSIEISDALKSEFLWATLRFNYSDLAIDNINEDSLAVYFFNETQNSWAKEFTILNKTGKYAEANVSHLSTFALGGDETSVTTTPTTAPPSGGGGGSSGWGVRYATADNTTNSSTTTATTIFEADKIKTDSESTTTTTSEDERTSISKDDENSGPTGLFSLMQNQPALVGIIILALGGAFLFFRKKLNIKK